MTHILHEPSAAATYYLKGELCELFDFLSSGFYVTPVHLSSSPESLLFLKATSIPSSSAAPVCVFSITA